MTGYALPAPKIGQEGLPLILAGIAISGLAVGLLVWLGKKNADQAKRTA